MELAILDETGFVHKNLSESDTLTAWAVITKPTELKIRLGEDHYNDAHKKFFKETTGNLTLIRIKTVATHEQRTT